MKRLLLLLAFALTAAGCHLLLELAPAGDRGGRETGLDAPAPDRPLDRPPLERITVDRPWAGEAGKDVPRPPDLVPKESGKKDSAIVKDVPAKDLPLMLTDRAWDKPADRALDKPKDRALDKPKDRALDKPKDRALDKPKDRALDKPKDTSPACAAFGAWACYPSGTGSCSQWSCSCLATCGGYTLRCDRADAGTFSGCYLNGALCGYVSAGYGCGTCWTAFTTNTACNPFD